MHSIEEALLGFVIFVVMAVLLSAFWLDGVDVGGYHWPGVRDLLSISLP